MKVVPILTAMQDVDERRLCKELIMFGGCPIVEKRGRLSANITTVLSEEAEGRKQTRYLGLQDG